MAGPTETIVVLLFLGEKRGVWGVGTNAGQ